MLGERGLRIALAASLLLNLFALGAAGGAVWAWAGRAHPAHQARRRPVMAAADMLPPADQARYLEALRQASRMARPMQQTARESRREAAALFVQPAYDPKAVQAALSRARDADFALRTGLEAAIVSFAQTLPAAERADLAKGLARGGPFRQPRPRQPPP